MRRAAVFLLALLTLAGCAGAATYRGGLQVVAAENVWGSIATQLGGSRAHVTSIVTSPAADPHDYEPTAADARTVAGAQLVIENGIGYDPWMGKLVASNPVKGRVTLAVGDVVGVRAGGNPHQWYSPSNVDRVAAAIAHDDASLDPKNAAYYRARLAVFEQCGLARFSQLIAQIRRRYHGVRVGASESIFAPLGQALGLDLVTPPTFLKAISEGTEPTVGDKTTIDRQIARRQIAVWVYNSQNSTPDVQRITEAARKRGIVVTTITETLSPASATFQAWQSRQLGALAAALASATRR